MNTWNNGGRPTARKDIAQGGALGGFGNLPEK
jgi:hypothetical protein